MRRTSSSASANAIVSLEGATRLSPVMHGLATRLGNGSRRRGRVTARASAADGS